MTIFQLECFAALADSLNFTQTASSMFITQPALSRAISSLEQELNMTLLIRSTHSVTLTPAGKAFAQDCVSILKDYRQSIIHAKNAQEGHVGSIRVGFQRDTFEPFAVDFFRQFERENPDIALELLPLSPAGLPRALETGEADAVVAGGKLPRFEGARRALLASRKKCVVLAPDHPLASCKSLQMKQLRSERFIVMSRTASCSGHESIIHEAQMAGFEPQIVGQVDFVPSLMMMVACGRGISVLYKDLEDSCWGRVAFVPLEEVETLDRWLTWDAGNENPCLPKLCALARRWEENILNAPTEK